MQTRALGKHGEDLAANFLQGKGYEIIDNNYYTRSGEIDLVARKDGQIIFVEVKTRTSNAFGSGEENIDRKKQQKLKKIIREYCDRYSPKASVRCDAVAIMLLPNGEVSRMEHMEDIFSEY